MVLSKRKVETHKLVEIILMDPSRNSFTVHDVSLVCVRQLSVICAYATTFILTIYVIFCNSWNYFSADFFYFLFMQSKATNLKWSFPFNVTKLHFMCGLCRVCWIFNGDLIKSCSNIETFKCRLALILILIYCDQDSRRN